MTMLARITTVVAALTQRQVDGANPAPMVSTGHGPAAKTQAVGKPATTDLTPDVAREPAQLNLAIQGAAGNITWTKNAATLWFLLPEIPWAFRPDAERKTVLDLVAAQYAELSGHLFHMRRTTAPYDVHAWADALNKAAKWVLPDESTWDEDLTRIVGHITEAGCHTGVTVLGVHVPGPRDLTALRATSTRLAAMLGDGGLCAREATEHEVAWMVVRSIILGLPAPRHVWNLRGPDSILALGEVACRFRERYGSTVRVRNHHTGLERHVAVVTVGDMAELTIPETHLPWLHYVEELPFPVEVSIHGGVSDSAAELERMLRLIRHQQRDYETHGIDQPLELERSATHARERIDQMKTGKPVDACSVIGRFRLAVSGADRDECLARVDELVRHLAKYQITGVHTKDQHALVREFTPGEEPFPNGYVRYMPVRFFASALPQAASGVGDDTGPLLGFTAGTGCRPVHFDPNYGPEHEKSGLTVIVAEPGAGKSTLIGLIAADACRRGVRATVLDPSGPLARLALLPGMDEWVQAIDLTGSQPGMLAPYALVPTPRRGDYPDTAKGRRDFEIALGMAEVERRGFVRDIATMLLPPAFAGRDNYAIALLDALRNTPAEANTTLDEVVDRLRFAGDNGDVDSKTVAGLLFDASRIPLAQLFFGLPQKGAWNGAPLTVITMAGLRLPTPGSNRLDWSVEEQVAVPMMHAAAWLAVRRCYRGEMTDRKLFALDESHVLGGWASGRHLVNRVARDSRKWNIGGVLATQNPKDLKGLDVENLVSTVFVGRVSKKAEIAEAALDLLDLPRGVGYEDKLAALSAPVAHGPRGVLTPPPYREFLMRDVADRVQRVRVDISHRPDLVKILNTTPGGKQ